MRSMTCNIAARFANTLKNLKHVSQGHCATQSHGVDDQIAPGLGLPYVWRLLLVTPLLRCGIERRIHGHGLQ